MKKGINPVSSLSVGAIDWEREHADQGSATGRPEAPRRRIAVVDQARAPSPAHRQERADLQ